MSNPDAFRALFETYEYTLKRNGFKQKGLTYAQADWNVFSRALSQGFFDEVQKAGIADTLIKSPPGRLMRDPLEWQRPDRPLMTTHDLFVHGVCKVRNSLNHGEKFRGDDEQQARDAVLIAEALAVLEAGRDLLHSATPPPN